MSAAYLNESGAVAESRSRATRDGDAGVASGQPQVSPQGEDGSGERFDVDGFTSASVDAPQTSPATLRERALREGKRRWLYVFDDLTGRAFKVRRMT